MGLNQPLCENGQITVLGAPVAALDRAIGCHVNRDAVPAANTAAADKQDGVRRIRFVSVALLQFPNRLFPLFGCLVR